MQPILHLSIPVGDLAEARTFYVEVLGCQAGRQRDDFADVWFYGMQVTLSHRPEVVAPLRSDGAGHYGVTLGRGEFEALVGRITEHGVPWLVPVTTDDEGRPAEQTKAKIADPSGNVIEVKTYRDVTSALEFSPHSYPGAAEHGN